MVKFANRYGIRFILASIAVNALIGIIAIVSGDFSDLDGKVLLTSLSVTGASILVLANLAARERGGIKYAPEIGSVASVIGFGILLIVVWGDISGDDLWKSAVTGILIGVGTAHGSLLSLTRLKPSYRYILWAAWAMAGLLIALLLVMIWNSGATDSTAFVQTLGVVGVLLAAATIAVPILHWSGRKEMAVQGRRETTGRWHVTHCPSCGSAELHTVGDTHVCAACGAHFSVGFMNDEA